MWSMNWSMSCEMWSMNCELWTVKCEVWTVNYEFEVFLCLYRFKKYFRKLRSVNCEDWIWTVKSPPVFRRNLFASAFPSIFSYQHYLTQYLLRNHIKLPNPTRSSCLYCWWPTSWSVSQSDMYWSGKLMFILLVAYIMICIPVRYVLVR